MSKRAVFLDRDGTIIEDTGFVRRMEDVKLLPRAGEAIRRLNDAGFLVVVVSNQSGVARGLLTEEDVGATNKRMVQLLKKSHAKIDTLYYCPHLPEGNVVQYAVICECRKPRPGMLLKASRDLGISLSESYTVGDAPRDVEAGMNAGTRSVLLTQSATRADQAPKGCLLAEDLLSAVEIILEEAAPSPRPELSVINLMPPEKEAETAPAHEVEPVEPEEAAPAEKPVEEEAAAEEEAEPERIIPIHRAPRDFTPEPEPEEAPAEAEEPEEPEEEEEEEQEEEAEEVEAEEEPAAEKPPLTITDRDEPSRTPAAGKTVQPAASSRPGPGPVETGAPRREAALCNRCGGMIYDADVEAGRAYRKGDVALCRECVIIMQAQKTHVRDVSNDELLRELQNITRALTYERFSVYHIFGMIAQTGALGALLVMWLRQDISGPYGLLWAIFLQLLALTLFVLGRQ